MSEEISELGAKGFGVGSTYAKGRPGYCEESVSMLVQGLRVEPGRTVVDVGAGTGKLTEQLAPYGATLIAVEPSLSMREEFARSLPDVVILEGSAEALPLEDHSVNAVVVAQAFHWFDPATALAEFARVLRPAGRLGLVWNERDESVDWVHQLSIAMQWTTRRPYAVGRDFRDVVTAHGPFVALERRRIGFSDPMDHERIRQRVLSTSYIAAASPAERDATMLEVDRVIASLPAHVMMPYLADTYLFELATT